MCVDEKFLKYRAAQLGPWLDAQGGIAAKINGMAFALLCVLDGLAQWNAECGHACVAESEDSTPSTDATASCICKRLRCSRSSYLRYRAELVEAGLLSVETRKGRGICTKSVIVLRLPVPSRRSVVETPVREAENVRVVPMHVLHGENPASLEQGKSSRVVPIEATIDYSLAVESDTELKRAEAAVLANVPSEQKARAAEVIDQNRGILSGACDSPPSYWRALDGLRPEDRGPGTRPWEAVRHLMLTSREVYRRAHLGHRPVPPERRPGQGRAELHELPRKASLTLRRWAEKHYAGNPDRTDIEKQVAFSVTVGTLRNRPLGPALSIVTALRSKGAWRVPYGYAPNLVSLGESIRVTIPENHAWRTGGVSTLEYPPCVNGGAH